MYLTQTKQYSTLMDAETVYMAFTLLHPLHACLNPVSSASSLFTGSPVSTNNVVHCFFAKLKMAMSPHLEQSATDSGEVHEHHARVDARHAVERVSGEAAVPANFRDLVLGSHGGQLGAVEGLEEAPDVIHWPQEEHICVHIQQGIHILQDNLMTAQTRESIHCFPVFVFRLHNT